MKKTAAPTRAPARGTSSAALYRAAQTELTRLLNAVLKTPVLRRRAGVRLKKAGKISLGLELSLVSEAEMTGLNRKFRRKNRPTDVLSFPSPEFFRKDGHLGDLIVCLPVLKAQARERGHPAKTELQVLLTHGLLHLLGFDHERGPKHAREMARWEAKLLAPVSKKSGLINR